MHIGCGIRQQEARVLRLDAVRSRDLLRQLRSLDGRHAQVDVGAAALLVHVQTDQNLLAAFDQHRDRFERIAAQLLDDLAIRLLV
ncbi:MAG: DUF1488 family protein [Planctomycetales bacterium]|nr:DUF1488 family protein [Planctomycetales bacterium]MCA9208445.1 DUF1488 family protein [Planctomycetales bacterium]